jgi:CheY-like chemotaxis protein
LLAANSYQPSANSFFPYICPQLTLMPTLKSIVYVDDDMDDRELLAESFKEVPGYVFVSFNGADELFEYLSGTDDEVCLVILDLNIPKTSGIEILAMLKSDFRYRKINTAVLTTGVTPNDGHSIRALETPIFIKPTSYAQSMDVMSKLIAHCMRGTITK